LRVVLLLRLSAGVFAAVADRRAAGISIVVGRRRRIGRCRDCWSGHVVARIR
jgi:hypothetical protein